MPNIADLVRWFSPKQAQLICDPYGGWSPPNQLDNGVQWAYASANSITVPSDATTYYSIGDRVRLKQGGGYKYFYIFAVAPTLLSITAGFEYSLTNTDITDYEISKFASPSGFPSGFNYTPVLTGFSVDPTTIAYRFTLTGRQCVVSWRQGVNGTSNATTFTLSAPITAVTSTNMYWGACCWGAVDNGITLTTPAGAIIQNGTATIVLLKDLAGNPWTNVNGKSSAGTLIYEV